MPCMRCLAEQVTSGSGKVLPALRRKLPLDRVKPNLRWAVMPAVIAGALILAFQQNFTMWVMVPAWLVFAYRLGKTAHCPPKEKRRDRREDPQDPQNGPDGQQSEEEREADTAAQQR